MTHTVEFIFDHERALTVILYKLVDKKMLHKIAINRVASKTVSRHQTQLIDLHINARANAKAPHKINQHTHNDITIAGACNLCLVYEWTFISSNSCISMGVRASKMSLILYLRFPFWFRWKMFAKCHYQKNAAAFGSRKTWNWLSHFHRCNKYQRKTSRIIQNIQVLINRMIEDWLPNIICGQTIFPFSLSCTTFHPVAWFFSFILFVPFDFVFLHNL